MQRLHVKLVCLYHLDGTCWRKCLSGQCKIRVCNPFLFWCQLSTGHGILAAKMDSPCLMIGATNRSTCPKASSEVQIGDGCFCRWECETDGAGLPDGQLDIVQVDQPDAAHALLQLALQRVLNKFPIRQGGSWRLWSDAPCGLWCAVFSLVWRMWGRLWCCTAATLLWIMDQERT